MATVSAPAQAAIPKPIPAAAAGVAVATSTKGAARSAAAESATDPKCYTFCGSVDFDSQEAADIVRRALEVDPELHPDQVSKELHVEDNKLIINFAATELRLLRAAVGTFYDMLALATRTVEQFGGPVYAASQQQADGTQAVDAAHAAQAGLQEAADGAEAAPAAQVAQVADGAQQAAAQQAGDAAQTPQAAQGVYLSSAAAAAAAAARGTCSLTSPSGMHPAILSAADQLSS
eukprot:jgi/Chrzof1/12383/Cz06g32140.t1